MIKNDTYCTDTHDTDICVTDQDMGEEYSSAEQELILRDVDPDKIDVVEFAEFIRWWCS